MAPPAAGSPGKTTTSCVQGLTVVIKVAPKGSVFQPGQLNPLRTGQAARRLQRTSSERFVHLSPVKAPPKIVEDDIDDRSSASRVFRHTFGRPRRARSAAKLTELAPHERELLDVDLHAHRRGSPATHPELLTFYELAGIDRQSVQTQSMALKKARRAVRPLFDDVVRDKSAEREIKADKHKVLTTVRRRGDQLRFASAVMRADKDVVLAAVATCGRALEHASHDLRDDKDVVLAAVRSDVTALRWASVALRADHDVFDVAMNQQPTASRHDVAKRPRPLVRDHMC
ncbi:DUF4116-containing protein [Aureococcus anophagefferens]|nr:DUF4116-containing protein [Aureococcus anophagefferens]